MWVCGLCINVSLGELNIYLFVCTLVKSALEGSLELSGSMMEFETKLNWELRKNTMKFIPQYRKWKELSDDVRIH